MDQGNILARRVSELFGERIAKVAQLVQDDLGELRGWDEPAHVRSVLSRGVPEQEACSLETSKERVASEEFGRAASEKERGRKKEAICQLLEDGGLGLEKIARGQGHDLLDPEILGLECLLLLYARPSLAVSDNMLASVPPIWTELEDHRAEIDQAQRGVGRIEMFGHPEYDWAGTGFLVNESCLITTRRTAELFAEKQSEQWHFRPNISTWMDYRSHPRRLASAGYQVKAVMGSHDVYDLALLEVEPPQPGQPPPLPLLITGQPQVPLENRLVYLIGYPVRDARRRESDQVTQIFQNIYNGKRILPGKIRDVTRFRDAFLLHHDCVLLGQMAGSCLIDLETNQVLGLHLTSRYLEVSTAIPLWVLREDPLFRNAGISFAEATSKELERTKAQVERLARSRYWTEVRATITNLYQQAFPDGHGAEHG